MGGIPLEISFSRGSPVELNNNTDNTGTICHNTTYALTHTFSSACWVRVNTDLYLSVLHIKAN